MERAHGLVSEIRQDGRMRMLTERQIRNKLYEYAEMFSGAYMRKEWARAKLFADDRIVPDF